METKRVTGDFSDRSIISPWTPDELAFIMNKIETIFEECDEELAKAGMAPLGYEKQPIGTMIEHMVTLVTYAFDAHSQCYTELDHPLYVGFKNGATETLSNIVLDDITTDNTFEMQKYVEVYDVEGTFYRGEVKPELSMKDFLGLDEIIPGEGAPVLENVETIGWFKELFRADYECMSASVESVDQMLEIYLHGGEYGHKEYHSVGNFVSGILDVTIVKPFIESIWGHDLITGEKLTDFERGMQLVNAVVGAVTFGQGAMALNFAEMTGKEAVTALVKIWAVDAVADMSAYTVGYACDELGMPAGITFLASLATGCTVSVKAGKYVFQDASGSIVKELDADGMWEYVGGGEYKGSKYSLFGEMTFEDGKQYSAWSKLREGGLSFETAEKIKYIEKGQKPVPETYLSKEYIEKHLQSFKDSGIVKIMPNEPRGTIGGKGGTFVLSGDELNEIIQYANGDISKIEAALGLDPGYLGENPVIVTVEGTSSIRIPSGNELGALPELWEPGGYTRGGIKEAVIDPVLEGEYTFKHLFE